MMKNKKEIKFYKVKSVSEISEKDALYCIKGDNDTDFRLVVTDIFGNIINLEDLNTGSGGGGGIQGIVSTDGTVTISGTATVKDIKVSAALVTLINSALQIGDNISNLFNDVGYITLADISSLIREEFVWTSGAQVFTLIDDYAQVYSVEVQGQGSLSTSQYTLISPNKVQILDTLDVNDYITIIYSAATGGVVPYYTQAQTDALIAGKEDKSNKQNSLATDGTGTKYPTVDAVNAGFAAVSATPDATTTIKGKVKLAGDLGGTADLPTVPGLLLKEDKSNKQNSLTVDGSGNKYPTVDAVNSGLSSKENTSNKTDDIETNKTSSIKFPSTLGVVTWIKDFLISNLSTKTTIVDADTLVIGDSADSDKTKKISWLNIKSVLKTYFDTLYQAVLVSGTNIRTLQGNTLLGSTDLDILTGNVDLLSQVIVSTSQNVQEAWKGKVVIFTSNCTITVPSTLSSEFAFQGVTLAGVIVTWATTAPKAFLFGTPTPTPEKSTFHLLQRGTTNDIILLQ